jgi:hypothetical protein
MLVITEVPVDLIASEMLCSMIHPDVMSLEFTEYTSHRSLVDVFKADASRCVLKPISKLRYLKTL